MDETDQRESKEAERRFNETVRQMINTPPKPRGPKEGREPKPAPKKA